MAYNSSADALPLCVLGPGGDFRSVVSSPADDCASAASFATQESVRHAASVGSADEETTGRSPGGEHSSAWEPTEVLDATVPGDVRFDEMVAGCVDGVRRVGRAVRDLFAGLGRWGEGCLAGPVPAVAAQCVDGRSVQTGGPEPLFEYLAELRRARLQSADSRRAKPQGRAQGRRAGETRRDPAGVGRQPLTGLVACGSARRRDVAVRRVPTMGGAWAEVALASPRVSPPIVHVFDEAMLRQFDSLTGGGSEGTGDSWQLNGARNAREQVDSFDADGTEWPLVVVGPAGLRLECVPGKRDTQPGRGEEYHVSQVGRFVSTVDPETTSHTQTHPGLSAQAWLFPDDAGTRRRSRRHEGHCLRARQRAGKERSPAAVHAQGPLFGAYAAC